MDSGPGHTLLSRTPITLVARQEACLLPHHVDGLPASAGHIGGPQLQVLQLMGGGGGGGKS